MFVFCYYLTRNVWKYTENVDVLLPRQLFDNLWSSTEVTQSCCLWMGCGREQEHIQPVPTGEWGREKPSSWRGCWSSHRLSVPWGGACAALQNPSTEWGSSVGSGAQLGLLSLGAGCEWTDRGLLGFSSCLCGDGNLPGSLIKWGLCRKLLFQTSVFVVLLPLLGESLCDRSLRQIGMLCLFSQFLTPLSVSPFSLLFAWVFKLFYLVLLNWWICIIL